MSEILSKIQNKLKTHVRYNDIFEKKYVKRSGN